MARKAAYVDDSTGEIVLSGKMVISTGSTLSITPKGKARWNPIIADVLEIRIAEDGERISQIKVRAYFHEGPRETTLVPTENTTYWFMDDEECLIEVVS